MIVRRLPALLAALLLGLTAAYAVACGEDEQSLISAGRAEGIKKNLDDVEEQTRNGNCAEVARQLADLQGQLERLPRSTDPELRERLEEGIANLGQVAPRDCTDARTETTPTTGTTTTPTDTTPTTPTDTTPTTPTTTTPTTPTTTTPTTTTPTTPPETTPTTPPEPTPTPPPEGPTGGDEAPGTGFVPPGQAKKQERGG